MRTASVLEIYNEAIRNYLIRDDELIRELRKLNFEKKSRVGADKIDSMGHGCIRVVLILLLVLIAIGPFIILGSLLEEHYSLFKAGLVFIIAAAIAFFIIKISPRAIKSGNADYNARKEFSFKKIKNLEKSIRYIMRERESIKKEIAICESKKSALLKAEEAMVDSDMEITSQDTETKPPSPQTGEADLEKVCPMCAESVKKAAKICRYCGHKFE